MQIVTLILKAIAKTIMDIFGLVVVPVALLFTDFNDDCLPHWAYPWCNEHDSINGYSNRNHWEERYPDGKNRTFWPRFHWLALRNRSTNFCRMIGIKTLTDDKLNIRWSLKLWTNAYLVFKLGYTHGFPGTTWYGRKSDKHHFVFSLDTRRKGDL